MSREFKRTDRVGQQLVKALATIMQRDVQDARLGMVTVNDVEISRDLAYAKVFVTFLPDDEEKVKVQLKVLNEKKGMIRTLLASAVRLRAVPELKFIYDSSIVDGMKMSELVSKVVRHDKKRRVDAGPNDIADDQADSEVK